MRDAACWLPAGGAGGACGAGGAGGASGACGAGGGGADSKAPPPLASLPRLQMSRGQNISAVCGEVVWCVLLVVCGVWWCEVMYVVMRFCVVLHLDSWCGGVV